MSWKTRKEKISRENVLTVLNLAQKTSNIGLKRPIDYKDGGHW